MSIDIINALEKLYGKHIIPKGLFFVEKVTFCYTKHGALINGDVIYIDLLND